jgi:hypothetical protein
MVVVKIVNQQKLVSGKAILQLININKIKVRIIK